MDKTSLDVLKYRWTWVRNMRLLSRRYQDTFLFKEDSLTKGYVGIKEQASKTGQERRFSEHLQNFFILFRKGLGWWSAFNGSVYNRRYWGEVIVTEREYISVHTLKLGYSGTRNTMC
jgi:hypothetical protein